MKIQEIKNEYDTIHIDVIKNDENETYLGQVKLNKQILDTLEVFKTPSILSSFILTGIHEVLNTHKCDESELKNIVLGYSLNNIKYNTAIKIEKSQLDLLQQSGNLHTLLQYGEAYLNKSI